MQGLEVDVPGPMTVYHINTRHHESWELKGNEVLEPGSAQ
jgi:hypothetical protein